ncbi:hypothetical protein [Donghicola sp. XS_ASV15]|uniref:hypothetical protein n=1 Tax=Donghicola sp. XS_ASV15 TaxID=3241295 RepID=UPI003512E2A6
MLPRLVALCASFWLMSSGGAIAQTIMAGEHDGFTRIVVRQADQDMPEVTQAEGRLTVTGITPIENRDLIAARQKIGATRVGEITLTQSGLSVLLNCDCQPETFTHLGYFVVDILRKKSGKLPVVFDVNVIQPEPVWDGVTSTLSAACRAGTWCEEFTGQAVKISHDIRNACRFDDYLIDLKVLKASKREGARALSAYFHKGWADEARLVLNAMPDEPFVVIGAQATEDTESCMKKAMERSDYIAWETERAETSGNTWVKTKPRLVELLEPLELNAPEPALAAPQIEAPQNLSSLPLHERAQLLLDSYTAATE